MKQVNDRYGHEEGDFYIRSVADYMSQLKKEGQILMRYGGDEFVVMGKVIEGNEFTGLIETLNPRLKEYRKKSKKAYEMSVSVGFRSVEITKDFKLGSLIEAADYEMYKMKKGTDSNG
ncbi:MAG: GGDEF domain-containing protein [Ruminococcus sp.]|nr:GGDEF domain-containing protein [Ruminococcus sp.]